MIRRRLLRRIAYVRRNRCSVLVAMLCFFILLNPLLSGAMIDTTTLSP